MERLNSLNAKLLTSTWVRRSALIFSRNMNHRLKKGKWITNIYLVKWQHIYIREKNKRYPSYLWNLPSPDNLNHKFLRYRLKILAHNDVVVVCLTNNETKAEILWNNNKNKKRKRKLGRAFSFGENARLSHYLLSLPSLLCSFTGDWSNSRHTPLSRYSHPRRPRGCESISRQGALVGQCLQGLSRTDSQLLGLREWGVPYDLDIH